ncbi:MAG: DUF1080 domain-containing protein [Bacteroidales bacterium]|nr:DUF1080 domain-containing protein [Bacteroidales bacterium]
MKNRFFTVAIIITSLFISVSCNNSNSNKQQRQPVVNKVENTYLFTGIFNNWVLKIADETVDPNTIFTIENDSIIHVKGDPFGYMRTVGVYSNYKLHVEYCYPFELSNSGVFVHMQEPDNVWPVCIENQLAAGSAGMFVLMNGANANEADQEKAAQKVEFNVINKQADSSEKAQGEWNTIEIICQGDQITNYVNGVLQNKATGLNVTEGHICLQSEGKDILFKNVYITEL